MVLIGCLRQGLTFACDSIWEPLTAAAQYERSVNHLETAAEALVEMLSALARRQHEHRECTADRLTAVVDTGRLPDELHEMAFYYLAKAQRDLGRSAASQHGMSLVADGGGWLAPPTCPTRLSVGGRGLQS
ncbi:hypothetical protein [Streptomyces kronopolitis]|uniref:hypothetical protein n=1 Tax=Streptomyces kronopolitis TaxID=1612435 RepID=UPI003D9771DE